MRTHRSTPLGLDHAVPSSAEQVDYLGGHLLEHFGITDEGAAVPAEVDEEVLARMQARLADEAEDGTDAADA